MIKLVDGINPKMSNSDYHGNKTHLSSSALKMILKNPEEYFSKYVKGDLSEEKAFFTFGNYIHTLILEPELVEEEFAVYDGAVKRGKLYEQFKANIGNKLVITASEAALATRIMDSYNAHSLAPTLFSNGTPEGTFAATIDGVMVKARLDYLIQDAILDVKTTGSALDMQTLQSTIMKYDYDLSAALYLDVVNAALEINLESFIFCFISKETCDIVLAQASKEMIENGRRKYKRALLKYKDLFNSGYFNPNKPVPAISIIDLPTWGRFNG
jgi:hypothetical protein